MFSFSRRGRRMVISHSLNKQQKDMILSGGYKMHTTANHISVDDDVRRLCKQGQLKEALHVLQVSEKPASSLTYACLLHECSKKRAISEGRSVHAHMTQVGFVPERFLSNTLLNMFAKCGSLVDARRVFDGISERDAFSWTVMISAYTRYGPVEESLALFHEMQWTETKADQFTFAGVLPAMGSLDQGRAIHAAVIRSGFQSDVFVGSALLDMYAKCRSLEDSRQVFDEIPQGDVVLWNAMIAGYAHNGYIEEAMTTFEEMPMRNVVSWNAVIAGCAQSGHVDEALKLFHAMPERNLVSWNAIIAAYVRVRQLEEALNLFWRMPERDVVSWTTIIAGHAQNGHDERALELYREMQLSGVKPNLNTFAGVLPACVSPMTLKHGMAIHEEIIRSGFQSDAFVESALIGMYAKCGRLEDACQLFDRMLHPDVVCCTAMIAAYAHNGNMEEALSVFQKMPEQNKVSWNAMLAGYLQNGHVDEALQFFLKMPESDVASWTTLITGCTQNGHAEETLNLFQQMQRAGFKPGAKVFASVLSACGNLAALEYGSEIHEEIIRNGLQSDVFVANSLIDMYAKCGSIENARNIFDKMHKQNTVSWTAIIAGYAMHGCSQEALILFEQMQEFGIYPDQVTFLCVLSACCHAGLVDEGFRYFVCMNHSYNIAPTMEHYGCMVDLLGRAGRLNEAQDFINKMPIKPDASVWGSLLSACRIHNNTEVAEHAAEHLFELVPNSAAPYVVLSNIYAAAGRWDDIKKVRNMMKDRSIKKMPGCSWIEVNKRVHSFLVENRPDPQTHKILQVTNSTG